MNLNKTLGRVATTLVAGAMLTALAMPVYADEFTSGSIDKGATELETLTFTKELIRPTVVNTPNVTFTFTMTGLRGGEEVTDTAVPAHKTITEDAYVDGAPMTATGSVTFGDGNDQTGSTTISGATCITDKVNIDISELEFTTPGVYKFSLTEDSSDANNPAYLLGITNENPYSVYVFVQDVEGSGIIATGAELVKGTKATNDISKKADSITNYYMTTPTGVTPNSVTVDKTVTGTMGDKSNPFQFTVTIVAEGNRTFSATKDREPINVEKSEDAENTYTVTTTLANGQNFVINGLLNGDKYTVNEVEANRDGYTTTVAGDVTKNNTQVTFDAAAADTVHYTNNRDAVSPTGIVMNVAPYVLLVVVAATGCFVFLRKRRED